MCSNADLDFRICQVLTTNWQDTGSVMIYRLSHKNRIDNLWYRLPPSVDIISGVIRIKEEFRVFQGHFKNKHAPQIKELNTEENTYEVKNFSGALTDAIFDIKVGSVLIIDLGQFGISQLYRFARFTL
ncbi:MAG: hypothetical protein KIH89_000285 [Candidatus Shapirobacteria bacterium]|nr:hypothetical protein [Candidatus Shapirobacteria bacterium]